MLPPRPSAVAVATCAAASLAGPSGAADESASVQAAAQLARHAALDSRAALSAGRSRRAQQLLARANRRLAYSYALTARLLTDHVPACTTAAAIFIQAASEVAHDSAALASRTDGRLQALASTALQRTSRLQEDVALELSTARSAGSIEDLIEALAAALRAQDALLRTLDGAVGQDSISRRHQRALKAAATRANAARDELRAALAAARDAVQHAPPARPIGDDPAVDEIDQPAAHPQQRSASDAGRNERSDLS